MAARQSQCVLEFQDEVVAGSERFVFKNLF